MADDASLEFYEEHILPNGQVVYYSDATHTYIVGGKEVPSITSLLPLIYGDTYSKVNPALLKAAAQHGTAVHNELQQNIDGRLANSKFEIHCENVEAANYFKFVEPIWKIEPIVTEKVVVLYDPEGRPCAAGRFDLLCNVAGKKTLADFKTTSTIHRQLVTAQLNLYKTAAIQSGYFGVDEDIQLGVIHLTTSSSKYVPIATLAKDFYLKFLI